MYVRQKNARAKELTPLPAVPSVVRTVLPESRIGDIGRTAAFMGLLLLRPPMLLVPPMLPSQLPVRAKEPWVKCDFGRSWDGDATFRIDEGADMPMALDGLAPLRS